MAALQFSEQADLFDGQAQDNGQEDGNDQQNNANPVHEGAHEQKDKHHRQNDHHRRHFGPDDQVGDVGRPSCQRIGAGQRRGANCDPDDRAG